MPELDPQQKAVSRQVFIIHDKVAENFIGQIVVDRHSAPVTRLFHQLLGDKQTQLAQHPQDYALLHIGYIEDSGRLWPIDPTVIATGAAWLAAQESSNA
jgi:hypothetical protein